MSIHCASSVKKFHTTLAKLKIIDNILDNYYGGPNKMLYYSNLNVPQFTLVTIVLETLAFSSHQLNPSN
jgi:hypothetical protein